MIGVLVIIIFSFLALFIEKKFKEDEYFGAIMYTYGIIACMLSIFVANQFSLF